MKVNVVTIGLGGDQYEFYAGKAIELARKYLPVNNSYIVTDRDISSIKSLQSIPDLRLRSFYSKFHTYELTRMDEFLYIDCDVAFVSRPPSSQLINLLATDAFLAVRDRPYSGGLIEISEDAGVPFGTYINAGVYYVKPRHKRLFEYLIREYQLHGKHANNLKFGDQYILNQALHRFRNSEPTNYLHRFWNTQDWNPSWGILPYAIHSSGNYPRYCGQEPWPEFPTPNIETKQKNEGKKEYTRDGFLKEDGIFTGMYHMYDKRIITYKP